MEIIGGPIVRRVEPSQAYLWIALNAKPDSLDAVVTLANGRKIAACTPASQKTVQLGDNLFIALLKLVPDTRSRQFPIKRKLYYDIIINGKGLNEYASGITYPDEKLPSFFVPEKHQNILHGSCRKPHAGEGGKAYRDMMVRGDTLVNSTVDALEDRPSMLVLTGDQIYADDVATSLLAELITQSKTLTGWDELMPPKKTASTIPAKIKLCGRANVLNRSMGFSSGAGQNHLMSFGEYMAMYLVSWGGLTVKLPEYSDVKDRLQKKTSSRSRSNSRQGVRVPYQSKSEYEKEKSCVEEFLKAASRARRLMANVPTYMIFDDHEVTDDWNLTEDHYNKLRTIPLSRRVASNALAAYWACQGWGNDPENFPAGFIQSISDHVLSKHVGDTPQYENALLTRYWGYEIDGYPVTIVLDTRTQRHFDSGSMPQLINEQRLSQIRNSIVAYKEKYAGEEDAQSVVIVSPAPVYGFKAVELLQLSIQPVEQAMIDAECWFGNKTGIRNLENTLGHVFTEYCLILSGDVHYGLNRMKILPQVDGDEEVKAIQLTSSSLCNSPGKAGRKFFKTLEKLTLSKLKVFNRFNSHYLKPKGQKKEEILTGYTNIGLLQFDAGLPSEYQLLSHDSDRNKANTWKYDLQHPEIAHY